MSGHTKGRWHIDSCSRPARGNEYSGTHGGDLTGKFFVEFITERKVGGMAEVEANAHLAAAAPDLLEALENCERRLTNMVGMSDLCANELQSSIDVARAAIARAKGER